MGGVTSQTLLKRIDWLAQQCQLLAKQSADVHRIASSHLRALEDLYSAAIEYEKRALREGRWDSAWPELGGGTSDDSNDAFPQPLLEIQIDVQPHGKGLVSIDGGWPFLLSRKLTCLLFHAASDDRHLVDGLPAFRSVSELKQSVREFAGSDVGNLIYRLREALEGHHWPRLLLQTDNRRDGYYVRFRVRRLVISGRLPRDWRRAAPRDDLQRGSA